MDKTLRGCIGTAFLALIAASAVAAQGSITGRVTDPFGAAITGANVILTRESDIKEQFQWTLTDSDGEYTFAKVPFGIFRVHIKWSPIEREFTKRVELNSKMPAPADISFSFDPCSDEENLNAPKINDEDRAEIVRSLIAIRFGKAPKSDDRPLIFSPENISVEWLLPDQRSRISILSRDEIQILTERSGELYYYTLTGMNQKGRCVRISLLNNLTVKGQTEDANMAGGSDTYEFRKIGGKWIVAHVSSTIS